MSRIRSIHPGFWTDEATLEMSMQAQLFLIGLWNEADDGGAFAWKPRQLKARLMPVHQFDAEEILAELSELGVICQYDINGTKVGAIRNFGKWQSPKKPSRKFPMPGEIVKFCATEKVPNIDDETPLEPQKPNKKDAIKSSPKKGTSSELVAQEYGTSSEPVRNRFPTSSEPVPTGEERRGKDIYSHSVRDAAASEERGDEISANLPLPQTSALQTTDPTAGEIIPFSASGARSPERRQARSARGELFSTGLSIVRSLTGKPEGAARGLLGRWAKTCRDDIATLNAILREADSTNPIDPIAWIEGAVKHRFTNGWGQIERDIGFNERPDLDALAAAVGDR